MASDPAVRASERIRRFGERQPDALRLARYASLAVSVDAPLLRALRRTLLPGSDAGIEADLWFSPLTESVSAQGFVLDADVVAQLRDELAAELNDERQQATLDTSASVTARMHRHWPESLRLEERATALALRTPGAATAGEETLETLLRGLVKAMTEDPTRGMEIARWAQRALRRLPKAARETEAALLLALGAAERLGMPIRFSPGDRPGPLPASSSWVLPAGTFSRQTDIGLRPHHDGIQFDLPEQAPLQVRLPLTTPLYLEISWQDGGARSVQTVSVAPGRTVPFPPTATDVRLRTLAGTEFALESEAAPAGTTQDARPLQTEVLADACVQVIEDASPPRAWTGFFVSRDTILTTWPPEPRTESLVGTKLHVQWRGETLQGTLVAHQRPSTAVLIRLQHPVEGALVLHPHRPPLERGTEWETVDVHHTGPRLIGGIVEEAPRSEPDNPDGGVSLAWLRTNEPLESWEALDGAPLLVGGMLAGQFLPGPSSRAAARPYAAVEPFILEHVEPLEPRRTVFVSYAARDEYGKGLEMDEPALDRMLKALREAGLAPVVDTELPMGLDPLVKALNESDSAAFVWTPVSHATPESAHLERLALAYRNWVQPDFPLAAFRFRRERPPEGSPQSLTALVPLDLDRATDDELRQHTAAFARAVNRARVVDDQSGLEAVQQRLNQILEKKGTGLAPRLGSELIEKGVHADVDWESMILGLLPREPQELVDIATMFSFPAQTHEPLRTVANGDRSHRAFAINVLSVDVAHALIRRAWIGRTPPRSIVVGDEPTFSPLDSWVVLDRVHSAIAEGLDCSHDDAGWALNQVQAPLFVILRLRPLPPPAYVQELLARVPTAFLFFLSGNEGARQGAKSHVIELPGLEPGGDFDFLQKLEWLRKLVAPRRREQGERP